jgi:hypothetical protein
MPNTRFYEDPPPAVPCTAVCAETAAARRFLSVFFSTVLLGLGAFVAAHLALEREGLLPSPPLTATNCLDGKLADMRGLPLEDRTLVATGSSATWRNLDMAVFERRLPGTRAYNAAPCYLHMDQIAYFTGFMLERMPRVETVVTVVAPRDFDACPPEQTAIFDASLTDAFLSGLVPRWLPYLTGFRPPYLAREALDAHQEREQARLAAGAGIARPVPVTDAYGSSVLARYMEWRPPLRLDPRCYAGLAALEATVAARGARLVVATLPTMPDWAAAFDPEGRAIEEWTRRMAASLRRETSLLVDGRALPWDDSRFADPVHVIYPNHRPYTEFVASAMAERRPPPPPRTAER